jgi:transcriptional regulator with XRE-family HTH domain
MKTVAASEYYELLHHRLMVWLEAQTDNQKQIAEAIGVSQQSLTNYKKRGEVPKLHTLARLCERYRLSPAWLFLGDEADLPFAKAESWAKAVAQRVEASRAGAAPVSVPAPGRRGREKAHK